MNLFLFLILLPLLLLNIQNSTVLYCTAVTYVRSGATGPRVGKNPAARLPPRAEEGSVAVGDLRLPPRDVPLPLPLRPGLCLGQQHHPGEGDGAQQLYLGHLLAGCRLGVAGVAPGTAVLLVVTAHRLQDIDAHTHTHTHNLKGTYCTAGRERD